MVETWEWSGPLTPLAVTALAVLFGVLFALLALWVALPFALFGIRRHLREIQGTLEAIRRTLEGLHRAPGPATPSRPVRTTPGDPVAGEVAPASRGEDPPPGTGAAPAEP